MNKERSPARQYVLSLWLFITRARVCECYSYYKLYVKMYAYIQKYIFSVQRNNIHSMNGWLVLRVNFCLCNFCITWFTPGRVYPYSVLSQTSIQVSRNGKIIIIFFLYVKMSDIVVPLTIANVFYCAILFFHWEILSLSNFSSIRPISSLGRRWSTICRVFPYQVSRTILYNILPTNEYFINIFYCFV